MAHYLEYQTRNGYIVNWLVAGPQAIPVEELERFQGADRKLQIARHFYEPGPGFDQPPLERQRLPFGETAPVWQAVSCGNDRFVERTAFYHTCHYLRSWAYARLTSQAAQSV